MKCRRAHSAIPAPLAGAPTYLCSDYIKHPFSAALRGFGPAPQRGMMEGA
jgi:hypothetical protein